GATPSRVQIEVKLADTTPPGMYNLRIATVKGISNPVLVGIDALLQLPFQPKVEKLPAALHGSVVENDTLRTSFTGKRGQRIVVDVEAKRLGAALDPIIFLNDRRGVQIAWAQGATTLSGDARLEATLPADGDYSVELRDALYKAPTPNFFRLKIGELRYADLTFPLGARRGTE